MCTRLPRLQILCWKWPCVSGCYTDNCTGQGLSCSCWSVQCRVCCGAAVWQTGSEERFHAHQFYFASISDPIGDCSYERAWRYAEPWACEVNVYWGSAVAVVCVSGGAVDHVYRRSWDRIRTTVSRHCSRQSSTVYERSRCSHSTLCSGCSTMCSSSSHPCTPHFFVLSHSPPYSHIPP
jgi:hypothetical protein